MKFRTEIKNIEFPIKIDHKSNIVLLGSCFSDNIAEKLMSNKFKALSNPFGIIYNPISITKIVERIVNKRYPNKSEFVKRDDIWHHFDFHGDMSGVYEEEVSERVNKWIDHSNLVLEKADFVFLTYGTSIVYEQIETKKIVANNHKFPSTYFTKRRLNIKEIIESLEKTIELIQSINNKVKIIFTISPVRHIKSGIIENQRSKAALILAAEELINNTDIFYFPSYEIVLDDLRDYRFFDSDMIHPSPEAIDYIWEKFSEYFFNNDTLTKNIEIGKLMKSVYHRPFNSETKSHQKFLKSLKEKVIRFSIDNPDINFNEELNLIEEVIL